MPARIVSMKAVDANEIVVVVAFWGGRRWRACCRV
jgi:hypothetical protein